VSARERSFVQPLRLVYVASAVREKACTVERKGAGPPLDEAPASIHIGRRGHPQTPRVRGELVGLLRREQGHSRSNILARGSFTLEKRPAK
jgi:hypothetical protein